ncbi:MAG: hypothetical protein K0S76_324 [Herbinix sp.]|jgi:hypothetical protein|nr:hypothetical protein [Herbinix sp.]
MGQVKILAIGNSFSEDATHYLHQIAKADSIDTKVVNLYIGGCSVERHWHNIEQDAKQYLYLRDGFSTENYVSIKEALMEDDWDFVITQQASHDSGIQETYYPYIINLFQYMKEYAPKAELLLQQTWAYEIDSTHDCFVRYHHNQQEMYEKLCDAYHRAAKELSVRLIPCGDVIQLVRTKDPFIYEKGGMSLCRDGFHMHYIYGRYLLAATWYSALFHKNIMDNSYMPETILAPGEKADPAALDVIKECVKQIAFPC